MTGKKTNDWLEVLANKLPLMGHRNWIVVADYAYPLQTSGGIETVYTAAEFGDVLAIVMKSIDAAPHVRPIVYTDQELKYVTEELSSGVDQCRQQMDEVLSGHDVQVRPHEDIIGLLDEAGSMFNVLLLKTTLTIPYTTVFLQLDCGYWSDASEQTLRQSMNG